MRRRHGAARWLRRRGAGQQLSRPCARNAAPHGAASPPARRAGRLAAPRRRACGPERTGAALKSRANDEVSPACKTGLLLRSATKWLLCARLPPCSRRAAPRRAPPRAAACRAAPSRCACPLLAARARRARAAPRARSAARASQAARYVQPRCSGARCSGQAAAFSPLRSFPTDARLCRCFARLPGGRSAARREGVGGHAQLRRRHGGAPSGGPRGDVGSRCRARALRLGPGLSWVSAALAGVRAQHVRRQARHPLRRARRLHARLQQGACARPAVAKHARRPPPSFRAAPHAPRSRRLAAPQSHLPSFVRDSAKLKEMGVDVVACVATNDQCAPRALTLSRTALHRHRATPRRPDRRVPG